MYTDDEDYSDAFEDWGQTFDDMDSADWNDYLGGPDDDQIEEHYESMINRIWRYELDELEEDYDSDYE